jgi:hypothetical protein
MSNTDDPRRGVTIPAGVTVGEAAALVQVWLHENTDSTPARVHFVQALDQYLCDADFTDGAITVLRMARGEIQ